MDHGKEPAIYKGTNSDRLAGLRYHQKVAEAGIRGCDAALTRARFSGRAEHYRNRADAMERQLSNGRRGLG